MIAHKNDGYADFIRESGREVPKECHCCTGPLAAEREFVVWSFSGLDDDLILCHKCAVRIGSHLIKDGLVIKGHRDKERAKIIHEINSLPIQEYDD